MVCFWWQVVLPCTTCSLIILPAQVPEFTLVARSADCLRLCITLPGAGWAGCHLALHMYGLLHSAGSDGSGVTGASEVETSVSASEDCISVRVPGRYCLVSAAQAAVVPLDSRPLAHYLPCYYVARPRVRRTPASQELPLDVRVSRNFAGLRFSRRMQCYQVPRHTLTAICSFCFLLYV